MAEETKDLGAVSAAAVEGAGSSEGDAASHVAHTPGPWRREGAGDGLRIKDADGCSLFGNESYYPWCSDNEADWDLIAAAPEMYAALKECERFFGDRSVPWEWGDGTPLDRSKFRAALAKAEGRS